MYTNDKIASSRSQFPALTSTDNCNGRLQPIFFDNPGGTQVVGSVIEAVSDYYQTRCANVGGAFETSRRTDETVLSARQAMANLLGTADPHTIIFGPSMTSLTFHLARSFAHTINPGDEIIVTELDHDANVAPWRDLAESGAIIRTIPFDAERGTLDTQSFVRALVPGKTRLAAIGHASNALGTITNVKPLIKLAHDAGALAFVDAVQSVPHIPVDVTDLDCDFLACSSYKFFGPHAGILYGKREHLENLKPHKVRPAKNTIPHCWEQGTLNHEGLAGIAAAVRYLESLADEAVGSSMDRLSAAMRGIRQYEQHLSGHLIRGLQSMPMVKIYGSADLDHLDGRVPTVMFTHKSLSPRTVCENLGTRGICCWNGNYYALGVMERLNLETSGGAVRIGLCHYNTTAEIDKMLEIVSQF